jgi:hypothetical protein
MRFTDIYISRGPRYSLGRDGLTGRLYLSIPVSNRTTTYEEYYYLSEAELELFVANPRCAAEFAERCGRQEQDDRLALPPGSDRGVY